MRRAHLVALCTALCTLASAAPARAQRCVAPPGTAAVDQYCETLPEAIGNRPAEPGGVAGAVASRPAPVTPQTLGSLVGAGPQGRRLAAYLRQPTNADADVAKGTSRRQGEPSRSVAPP